MNLDREGVEDGGDDEAGAHDRGDGWVDRMRHGARGGVPATWRTKGGQGSEKGHATCHQGRHGTVGK